MTSYEFEPNPEFYGELMETSMSAREQLSRICGTNDQVLTEVDVSNIESLVDFICTNEDFHADKTQLVFEQIETQIENKMYDKTQFRKLFEYLIEQSCKFVADDEIELTESEAEYATQLLSRRFFDNRKHSTEESTEPATQCGKKSFKSGNAFENMQRIVSGHQMFIRKKITMKITKSELREIIQEVADEMGLFEGLTKAQEKLPEPLKKAILKKQGKSDDSEEKEDVEEGLTKAQEKLPEPLKKAILKKQGNSDDSSDEEKEDVEEGLTKAQEKLPEPLKKAILKKQGNSDDSSDDEEEDDD